MPTNEIIFRVLYWQMLNNRALLPAGIYGEILFIWAKMNSYKYLYTGTISLEPGRECTKVTYDLQYSSTEKLAYQRLRNPSLRGREWEVEVRSS